MLDFFEALIRAGASGKYFENPAALSFVIALFALLKGSLKLLTTKTSSLTINIHRTFWEIEMAKKYPVDFEAVVRTPSSRASKGAPTGWSGSSIPILGMFITS